MMQMSDETFAYGIGFDQGFAGQVKSYPPEIDTPDEEQALDEGYLDGTRERNKGAA